MDIWFPWIKITEALLKCDFYPWLYTVLIGMCLLPTQQHAPFNAGRLLTVLVWIWETGKPEDFRKKCRRRWKLQERKKKSTELNETSKLNKDYKAIIEWGWESTNCQPKPCIFCKLAWALLFFSFKQSDVLYYASLSRKNNVLILDVQKPNACESKSKDVSSQWIQ